MPERFVLLLWRGLVLKRAVDVAFSCLLLLLTLPILACLSLIVALDSDGPVLFRQARMGRRFQRFQLYKLRTMELCGDGPAYTLGADPRITRVGRWLRRFKLDELPQLWNVLRGDMSLVGPRPVIPELALEFKSAYTRLLMVRPGLTDPASLKYCNEAEILAQVPEPLRYFKSVVTPDKIRISQDYLKTATAFTDMSVAVRTVAVLLSPFRSDGVIIGRNREPAAVLPFPQPRRSRKVQPIFEVASSPDMFRLEKGQVPAAVTESNRQPRTKAESLPA